MASEVLAALNGMRYLIFMTEKTRPLGGDFFNVKYYLDTSIWRFL